MLDSASRTQRAGAAQPCSDVSNFRARFSDTELQDGRRVVPGGLEYLAHHPGALAQVPVHELGAVDADEGRRGVVRDGSGRHGLARARRAV